MNTLIASPTNIIATTKVAWISKRHELTPGQEYLLKQLHSPVIINHHKRSFDSPTQCVNYVRHLTSAGYEVYMSPVRHDMYRALRRTNLRWRFFPGYNSRGVYVTFGVIEMIGYRSIAII